MDLHPPFINRDISAGCLGPAAGVEILDAIPLDLRGRVSVATEDPVRTFRLSVGQCARGNLV